MLLRGETSFFVHSLRHYSVLIFNFSIFNSSKKKNVVTKLKSKNYIKCLVKILEIKNFKILKKIIYNYCITVHKLPMLKQDVIKTINAEFNRTA